MSRAAAAKSLPRVPSPAARARVFLIPYSGCGASLFRRWPHERGGVEYCPLQPPGREERTREPTFMTYTELAEELSRDLAPYLDRPYALFGHCGSALAAYEAAVVFQMRGLPPPARVYVSSQVAPQDGPKGRFLGMSDAELITELDMLIRDIGGVPLPGMLELYLEVLRADIEANKRYVRPEPARLSCPITAIGWSGDDGVPPATMNGWPRCGDTTSVLLDGEHNRFVAGPPELLDVLEAGLPGD
jgi:surfactin synthase thioesterase subunit